MRRLYRVLNRIAEQTRCALLVVHHDNRGGSYSGSSDINNSVVSRLHLERVEVKGEEPSREIGAAS